MASLYPRSLITLTEISKRILLASPLPWLLMLCLVSHALPAQVAGGNAAGQSKPSAVNPGGSDAGVIGGDVNLFTGVLSLDYDLGGIATLSGLRYPLHLQYESILQAPLEAAHMEGVPYGEGWTLANAGITVEVHAFDQLDAELDNDLVMGQARSKAQSYQRGQLYWHNARLSLPGGGGGRLVYKYKDDQGRAVYHLAAFEQYLEAFFSSSTWTVRTADGTEYDFGFLQWRRRNAPQNTDNLFGNNSRPVWPRVEPARWHLTEIRNPNHANGQKIVFDYHAFGMEEPDPVLQQDRIRTQLGNQSHNFWYLATPQDIHNYVLAHTDPVTGHVDSLRNEYGEAVVAGDTVYEYRTGMSHETVFKDLILKAVTSTDALGTDYQRVEFKYKSWRPETEMVGNPGRMERSALLLLSDPQVVRLDSLYSQKTVWFTGRDQTLASSIHPPRPKPADSLQFDQHWRRYMHTRAHQHPLSSKQWANHPRNPYLLKPGGWNGALNPNLWYQCMEPVFSPAQASHNGPYFAHSVLESPRLQGRHFPPGEWYELRTLTFMGGSLANQDMNLDIRIATGLSYRSSYWANSQGGSPLVPYGGMELQEAVENGQAGYWESGMDVYSTLRNINKWNPAYQRNGRYLQTRDAFYLPNLPNYFQGITVQVGPGADNMAHDIPDEDGYGYPFYFNNLDVFGQPRDSFALPLSYWFGTGAPLQPVWAGNWHGVLKLSGLDVHKGQNGARYQFWHHKYNAMFDRSELLRMGPNQPTAITRESLKAFSYLTPNNFNYNNPGQIDAAHEPNAYGNEDSRLVNMELIRTGRNPWMLDSVVFMLADTILGEYVRTGAYTFGYTHVLVPVLNNDNPDADPAVRLFRNGDYRMVGTDTLYRNVLQLATIRRHGADTLGHVNIKPNGITRIAYMKDDPNTPLLQESSLIRAYWNEMGGKTQYAYHFSAVDTAHLNANGFISNSGVFGNGGDNNRNLMGKGRNTDIRVPVKTVSVEDENGPLVTRYTFLDPIRCSKGYPIDAHFSGTNWNMESRANLVRGYRKAIVELPVLQPGANAARSEHIHFSALATYEDTLLFGKLKETRDYDAYGRLTGREQHEWKTHLAYHSGYSYFNHGLGYPIILTGGYGVRAAEGEFYSPFQLSMALGSWFVYQSSLRQVEFEPHDGDSAVGITDFGYFDWDRTRAEVGDEYKRMYNHQLPTYNFFRNRPFAETFVNNSNQVQWRFTYHAEPSWQLAWKRTHSPDRPLAVQRVDYYYLWDIEPFLLPAGTPNFSSITRFEGSHRPFWLCRRYGIRNTVYEEMHTTIEPRPGPNNTVLLDSTSLSTWYEYHVFRDVNSDIVWEHDSTNYGRRCRPEDTLIVPVVDGRMAIVSCLGQGEPVEMERATAEMLDDPLLVEGPNGLWWKFKPQEFKTAEYAATPVSTPGCPGGTWSKEDGTIGYFGQMPLAAGGFLDASQIRHAQRNYGSDHACDSLTAASKRKASPLVLMPHRHSENGGWCDAVHGHASDSLFSAAIKKEDSIKDGSGAKELMVDMLDWQFMIRAVYVQADTFANHYMTPDSIHNYEFFSRHNLWDTTSVPTPWHGSTHAWKMKLAYPNICTYKVHARNMHGLVVDESDVRHAHTLYEYGKGRILSWWDECGVPHTRGERKHFGLPLSVTLTDFGSIEQVMVMRYAPNHAPTGGTSPSGVHRSTQYDDRGRPLQNAVEGIVRNDAAYDHWNGDTLLSWKAKTAQNMVQTRNYSGPPQYPTAIAVWSRTFSDPSGRNNQAFAAIKGQTTGFDMRYVGPEKRDAWGRTTAAHKGFFKDEHGSLNHDPAVPVTPKAEMEYEAQAQSRPLKGSALDLPISGNKVSKAGYAIIPVAQYKAETNLAWNIVQQQFPTVSLAGAGSWGLKMHRQVGTDPDGRRVVSYSDATGRALASLSFTTLDSSTWANPNNKAVTVWLYDGQGRVREIRDPMGKANGQRMNVLSMPYLSWTCDGDTLRTLHNQAGDVVYSQDARQKAGSKATAFQLDRLGRVHAVAEVALVNVPAGVAGQLQRSPFSFANEGGIPFRGTHTLVDALARIPEDCNCSQGAGVFTAAYNDLSWRCVDYEAQLVRRIMEIRWDYRSDSLVAAGVQVQLNGSVAGPAGWGWNMVAGLRHSRLNTLLAPSGGATTGTGGVPMHMQAYKGNVALTRSYDPSGFLVEMAFNGYDKEGRPAWTAKQFRAAQPGPTGMQPGITQQEQGEAHVVYYKDLDLDGTARRVVVDIHADGDDWEHVLERDGWGQVAAVGFRRLGANIGPIQPIVSYTYTDVAGLPATEIHWASNPTCTTGVTVVPGWLPAMPADTVSWVRDTRDQLSGIHSRFFDFELYREGANPNIGNALGGGNLSGAAQVGWQQHWAGGINGWQAKYDLAGAGGPLPGEGWGGATVYGFVHDGMGRLLESDASVLDGAFAPGDNFANTTFGVAMLGTRKSYYGDEKYSYDKAGNLLGLRRHSYYKPGQALVPGTRKGDNWTYHYQPGSNRLDKLKTGGINQAVFTYDRSGALISDSRRNITVLQSELAGLPTLMVAPGKSVQYVYAEGGRIYKRSWLGNDPVGRGEFYLRGAGGEVLAVHDEADSTWTVQVYGLDLVAELELPDPPQDSSRNDTIIGGGHGNRLAPASRPGFRNLLRDALAVVGITVMTPGTAGQEGRPKVVGRAGAVLGLSLLHLMDRVALRANRAPHQVKDGPSPERLGDTTDSTWTPRIKFFVKDHLGNVRVAYEAWRDSLLCLAQRRLVAVMDYYPYGKLLRSWNADALDPERWQSTLHERDWETGWDMRGARLYDADYGRFLSTDPHAYSYPGISPYMYVLGDPVGLVDPTGMDVEGGDTKDGGGGAWETLDAENVNYNTKTVTITAKAPHNSRVWDAASGFAQRATEIALPLYGAAVGLYEFFAKTEQAFNSASRIVQGEGQTQDFLGTFAGVSFADEALGMYTFGQGLVNGDQGAYQQVGRMAFDAALAGGVGLVSGGVAANIGAKLEYGFGKATGSAHNIERSTAMLRQLQSVGIFDNAAGRYLMNSHLESVYGGTKGILQSNGRYLRESLLMGPNGSLKVESIWEGNKLITFKLFGGR